MSGWFNFFFDIGAWSAAVIVIFEGSRRLARGERGRRVIGWVAGGAIWCIVNGVVAFHISSTMESLGIDPNRPVSELRDDWSNKLSPDDREKSSSSYASSIYFSSGTIVSHFDRSGNRQRFAPTQEQIRERESHVALKQQMAQLSLDAYSRGWRWFLSAVLAVLIGWGTWRNEYLTANRPMQPTAGSGG